MQKASFIREQDKTFTIKHFTLIAIAKTVYGVISRIEYEILLDRKSGSKIYKKKRKSVEEEQEGGKVYQPLRKLGRKFKISYGDMCVEF